jgi:hypothetical protein
MKKLILLSALIGIAMLKAVAQDEEPEPVKGFDRSKLFVGGNFALNFGNYTIINISPQLGYRFNRFLAAGVGINGQYSSFKTEFTNGSTYSRSNYGVAGLNLFGRFYPINQAFIQIQPELNHVWVKEKYYDTNPATEYKLTKFVPSLLVGAGAAIPTGRGAFIVMGQYDVLQQTYTPYGDKIFLSIGYNMGF